MLSSLLHACLELICNFLLIQIQASALCIYFGCNSPHKSPVNTSMNQALYNFVLQSMVPKDSQHRVTPIMRYLAQKCHQKKKKKE